MMDFCLVEGVMVQPNGQFDHRLGIQSFDFQEAIVGRSSWMQMQTYCCIVYSATNWLYNGGKAGILTFPPIH